VAIGAERVALVAGCAGALALVTAPSADAAWAVEYGATGWTVLTSPAGTGTHYWIGIDLDGNPTGGLNGSGTEIAFAFYSSFPGALWIELSGSFGTQATNGSLVAASSSELAQKFNSTAAIAAHTLWSIGNWAALFSTTNSAATPDWTGQTGYIGFRMPDGGGGYTYGWVQLSVNAALDSVTILNWSAASAGGGAAGGGPGGAAGTPEPAAAGLGLLALGAAGVMRHRRRRKDKVA